MQVRPPKQIWIGRPSEHRFEVITLTGEEADERLAAEPVTAEELEDQPAGAGRRSGCFGRGQGAATSPASYGPRVYKPQVYAPGMNIGPSGLTFRKPQLHARSSRARR